MSAEQMDRLFYLCGTLRDEVITEAEFEELNAILETNPQAQDIYLDYVYLCTDLCRLQASVEQTALPSHSTLETSEKAEIPALSLDMLKAFGEYEKKAETLVLPDPIESPRLPLRIAPIEKTKHTISKLSVITFVSSLAALLVLIAYVHFVPQNTYEIATLTDSIHAQWSSTLPLKEGSRLAVSRESIHLQKGILKFKTDEGVSVVLESPAEFRFVGPSEIAMEYGRLFARVSDVPNGFTVQTGRSRIIDLGTEFGVYADTRGRMELHVYKGKTALIADIENQKQVIDVIEGQAKELNDIYNEIRPIQLNQNLFVRNIQSDSGLIWRQDNQYINLADIVGGGNGTGNGTKDRAIQWDGQKLLYSSEVSAVKPPSGQVVPVQFSRFIDSIFVPSSKGEEPIKLSSDLSSLSLNEFINQDTNGLVTLVLLLESDSISPLYWFDSKEGAQGNPDRMPSLNFPNAEGGPVLLTTADGRGADALVSNDAHRSPNSRLGLTSSLSCRYFKDQRLRMTYLRFDLGQISGDLSDAVLNLYLTCGNRQRALQVYGLKDGPAELWNEETIVYNTAPGLQPASLGNYRLDQTLCRPLGTFNVIDNRIAAEPISISADGRIQWTAPQTFSQTGGAISNTGHWTDPLSPGVTHKLTLGNTPCGTPDNPSILMHANAGITFDLEALRQEYSPYTLKTFTAVCGLPAAVSQEDNTAGASFYVLLDGQEVFAALDMSPQDSPKPIEIKLNSQARYLTLMTTQGSDNSIDHDLCLFVKPKIHIE